MRKCLLSSLALVFCFVLAAKTQAADSKPVVVLSLASYEDAVDAVESVGFVAAAPEMPAWLSSLFRLYSEGKEVGGLDHSRPWGAVIREGDKLSAFGFVPVKDAEFLAWELNEFIDSRTDVGGGIVKVVGTEPGKTLYAMESNGWLFVSDCQECLQAMPYDPVRLLGGMDKQYDVAVRLQAKDISRESGDKLLAEIDEKLGPGLRKIASEQTLGILAKAAHGLHQVTLGWTAHD